MAFAYVDRCRGSSVVVYAANLRDKEIFDRRLYLMMRVSSLVAVAFYFRNALLDVRGRGDDIGLCITA